MKQDDWSVPNHCLDLRNLLGIEELRWIDFLCQEWLRAHPDVMAIHWHAHREDEGYTVVEVTLLERETPVKLTPEAAKKRALPVDALEDCLLLPLDFEVVRTTPTVTDADEQHALELWDDLEPHARNYRKERETRQLFKQLQGPFPNIVFLDVRWAYRANVLTISKIFATARHPLYGPEVVLTPKDRKIITNILNDLAIFPDIGVSGQLCREFVRPDV